MTPRLVLQCVAGLLASYLLVRIVLMSLGIFLPESFGEMMGLFLVGGAAFASAVGSDR